MPNVYYCQPGLGLGMLRVVLSWEAAKSLLKLHPASYAGRKFPSTMQDPKANFAVLRVLDTESDKDWRIGFYTFDVEITAVEVAIQTHAEAPLKVGAKQQSNLLPGIGKPGTLTEEPPNHSQFPGISQLVAVGRDRSSLEMARVSMAQPWSKQTAGRKVGKNQWLTRHTQGKLSLFALWL